MNIKKQGGFTPNGVFSVFFGIILILGMIGWIMNIIAIISTMAGPISGVFIVRLVGIIVAPLGAIMGWL